MNETNQTKTNRTMLTMRKIELAKRALERLQSKVPTMRGENMREHAPTKNNRVGTGCTDRSEHTGLGEVWSAGIRAEAASEGSDNKCKKCNGEMNPSKAIECKSIGHRDFANDKYPCTVSPDPRQPMLVDCLKCSDCGWSITGMHLHFDERFASVDGA